MKIDHSKVSDLMKRMEADAQRLHLAPMKLDKTKPALHYYQRGYLDAVGVMRAALSEMVVKAKEKT